MELARIYRLGVCSAGRVLKDTCRAIVTVLKRRFVKLPSTPDDWMDEINAFDQRWHYPACVGALDGKHVRILKPRHAGSTFFNYKGYHSVVLMGLVNANYRFLFADVGSEGAVADGGVWRNCQLQKDISSGKVKFPADIQLRGTDTCVSAHIVGDDAFPLSKTLMKPYAKRELSDQEAIYNYRCSRARRIVENVFGVMAARFRVLHTEMSFQPKEISYIIVAIATLHNILREVSGASYMPPGMCDIEDNHFCVQPGAWRVRSQHTAPLDGMNTTQSRNASYTAKEMRDTLARYFVSPEGSVSWQEQYIHNTQANLMRNIRTATR